MLTRARKLEKLNLLGMTAQVAGSFMQRAPGLSSRIDWQVGSQRCFHIGALAELPSLWFSANFLTWLTGGILIWFGMIGAKNASSDTLECICDLSVCCCCNYSFWFCFMLPCLMPASLLLTAGILKCFGMYAVACFGMFWHVLACFGMFVSARGYTDMIWKMVATFLLAYFWQVVSWVATWHDKFMQKSWNKNDRRAVCSSEPSLLRSIFFWSME